MRHPRFALVALLCGLLPALSASAATWLVNPDGTGDFVDLRSAVTAAQSGDVVLLADGTYAGSENRWVRFYGKELTIRSESGNADACVFENTFGYVIMMLDGEGPLTLVENLTFRGPIGGFFLRESSPTIRGVEFQCRTAVNAQSGADMRIEDSSLEDGSSLFCNDGALTMTGCVLEAGAFVHSYGQVRAYDTDARVEDCQGNPDVLVLRGSTVEILDSEFQEALVATDQMDADVLLENCRFVACRRMSLGSLGSDVVIRNCSFLEADDWIYVTNTSSTLIESSEFRGGRNGGPDLKGRDVVLRDCLVAGNEMFGLTAHGWTGQPTTLLVEDCTIAGNGDSYHRAAGITLGHETTADVRRSILWSECLEYGALVKVEDGSSIAFECAALDTTLVAGAGSVSFAGDLVTGDPLFCDPTACDDVPTAAGNWTLREDSPALAQPCGVMGGLGVGCEPISVESVSWGALKALYR